MDLLKDKVAIVTGGGRGIGRAAALALAREGARVLVNDLGCSPEGEEQADPCAEEVVAQIREQGGIAEADRSNVSVPEAAQALVERASSTWGSLDILVNNAGIGMDAQLHRLDAAQWQRTVNVQLNGSFYCLRAASRLMKKAGAGSIINTTSLAGLRGNYGQAHGSAAAAGVIGLTRSASIELQKYGVRVNAIAPVAKTRLTEGLPMFADVDSMRAEHIAPVHVFLASELSRDVTGVVVCAAGGRLSVFRLVESLGALKEEEGGVWSAEEIAEHWSAIARS
ncbi:MAG TPA: SDR family NAD(P)-dependent oxidoreductase [Polyangiaceae bacterium]|jgi:NAD(P)-dependent dehydrogenase (short-subunit alcohol dehydrogenase family)|nr:SDR family NAD(P)-dependent oxidoreductase [Polyangiaceae bacterium]